MWQLTGARPAEARTASLDSEQTLAYLGRGSLAHSSRSAMLGTQTLREFRDLDRHLHLLLWCNTAADWSFRVNKLRTLTPPSASNIGSDSFLMKFAGDCGSSTENRRHADGLSNFIASTEWFGV